MLTNHKKKDWVESVELQIGLRDYDPEKDKRFNGAIVLPNMPAPKRTVPTLNQYLSNLGRIDRNCRPL